MIPCEVIGTTGRKAGSLLQLACWGHCGTPQRRCLSGWLDERHTTWRLGKYDWKSNVFPHTEQLSGGDPVQCPLICWTQVVCVPVAKMEAPWACRGTCKCYLWRFRKLQVLTWILRKMAWHQWKTHPLIGIPGKSWRRAFHKPFSKSATNFCTDVRGNKCKRELNTAR
jgi:hypothetical protein